MKAIEVIGEVITIEETVQVTESFKKRNFWLKTDRDEQYPTFLNLELSQDKVDLIEANEIVVGSEVKVLFSIDGRPFDKKDGTGQALFNKLKCFKLELPF